MGKGLGFRVRKLASVQAQRAMEEGWLGLGFRVLWGLGVRRGIVQKTMGRGQVVLSGGGLMGGELADCRVRI